MTAQEVLARHKIRSVDIPDDGFLLADGPKSWIFYPKKEGGLIALESPFPFVAAYGSRMPIPWKRIMDFVYSSRWYINETEEETLEHFQNRLQSLR